MVCFSETQIQWKAQRQNQVLHFRTRFSQLCEAACIFLTFTEAVIVTKPNKTKHKTYWHSFLLKNWVYKISNWIYEVQNSFADELEELKKAVSEVRNQELQSSTISSRLSSLK